ncbi:MAG: hypothetical protein KF906_05505 [Actinobacteria bacterium]|nr:hypothetical protein [Actinomycetota bacterium]
MTGIVAVAWVVSGICVFDAARRSAGEWAHADKDKGYWLMLLTVGGLFVLPAVVIVPCYLLGVLPKFGGGRSAVEQNPFSKR